MNICLVNNLYPPINTGSSFYTYDLANHLYKKGHKVIVITNQVVGINELTIEDGIKIFRLPVIKLPKWKIWMKFPDFNFTLTPKNIKMIKKILIDEKIELIHQCNNIFDLVFASSYFSRKMKIPLICSLTTQIQHPNPFFNKILELFDKTIIKYFFSKNVSKYIALDKESERYINNRYNIYKKITLIPFSIPKDEGSNKITSIHRNYKETHYKMVSLGHVSELKNRIEIIKAWKLVTKKYPKAKIIIVGDIFSDPTKKLISELKLNNNIIFTGRINHNKIYKHLIEVDFGCMFLSNIPYNRGLGTANMELMASGLPILADMDTNFFGNDFPIKSGKDFIKANSREPKWLADKFIELFEKSDLREQIGKSGKRWVTEVITWDRIINKLEAAYREVINKRNQ